MQLLRTIFIILLAYYIIRIVSRYVLPWLAKYFIKRTFSRMENQQQQQAPPRKKEGEVSIDYQPEKKEITKDVGDYVDYEDVED